MKGQEREEHWGGDRPKRKKEMRDGREEWSPARREIDEGIGRAMGTTAVKEYSEWVEVKWQREQASCLKPSGWWWKTPAKRKKAKEMERNKKDFRFMELIPRRPWRKPPCGAPGDRGDFPGGQKAPRPRAGRRARGST